MKEEVAILIINYNTYEDTIECVNSIKKSVDISFKIFILDNASVNDSYSFISEKCKDCVVVRSNVNLGFGGGNNKLIEVASEQGFNNFLLLNSDTVIEPDMIKILNKYHKKENVVTPRMMYYKENNIVWYGGGKFSKILGIGFHKSEDKEYVHQVRAVENISFLTGCCLMISKEVIDRIGGLFDEKYFMYYEDVDLSYRLIQQNIEMLYIDTAVLYHKVSATTGGTASPFTVYYGNRNRLYFMKKFKISPLGFIYFFITRVIKIIKMNEKQRNCLIEGIRDGFKNMMGNRFNK